MTNIRNIAIIAHVDHGKTTLVDAMLKQTGTFRENQEVETCVMDSGDLEKERGITILAKCTSVIRGDTRINIVDTPGHADFGGEVERVLSMVDGVVLLVDAAEGPMPQTKFVLMKALNLGLRPIVLINKIDRGDARPDEVVNEVFDLFVALEASDQQLDFPVLYASGRSGWCVRNLEDEKINLDPLFETILSYVEAPDVDKDAPFAMLATILSADPYLGRILTGRIYSGRARVGIPIRAVSLDGKIVEQGRMTKLLSYQGIKRVPINEAEAGDIVCVAGLEHASVSDTIGELAITTPIASTPVDPPTMAITISVNDSPLAGKEGTKVTSRLIAERLFAEAESNVAISVKETDGKDAFEVGGRGELQLGVLIETMRREGFEVSVSRPRVLLREDPGTGEKLEPIEEVLVDVDEEFTGVVVEKISLRKGEMKDMRPSGGGKTRIVFHVPARGLIGYQSEFMTDTRGTGIMNRLFHGYGPYKGDIPGRRNGALISTDMGEAVAYAIWNLQDRGVMFINPQQKVYAGMIVGEHSRDNDLEINVLKGKQLTNIRTTSKDEAVRLIPPLIMTLEQMMSYIEPDELVEVTPKSLRLRKKSLDANERKRMSRDSKKEARLMGSAMILKAVLLALICGVAEFLPVSSNGHVIILKELLGFEGPPGKLFEMSLQLGAISAVCWLYRAKILHTACGLTRNSGDRAFALNILVACIPAVVVGALFHKAITEYFFNAYVVASMLVVGGILILIIEKYKPEPRVLTPESIGFKAAILIGLYQMLAMIPGVSRSGATIMGAMTLGVERKAATEFSFFLAIPMIFMAAFFDLFLHRHELDTHGISLIALGFAVAFISAVIVVKWLLTYLSRHGFVVFAWYRIIAGSAVLALLWMR